MLEAPPKALAEPGRAGAPPTFAACATWYIDLHRHIWAGPKRVVKWERTLARHAYPHIGDQGVDQITTEDVLALLEPIWASIHDTALRVRQQIQTVLEWATVQGYRDGDNPADGLTIFQSLPRQRQNRPHRSVPCAEVSTALRRVTWSTAHPSVRISFRLLVLTTAWPADVRFAEWSEIDWEQRIWTVPASRSRVRSVRVQRPHRIPLSDRAMHLLDGAWELSRPEGGLIFPTERDGRPLSDAALLRLLQRLDIPAVPSGFRNSFQEWCAQSGAPPVLVKATLSRTTGKHSADAAFLETGTFQRMRTLLQDWTDYCMPDGR